MTANNPTHGEAIIKVVESTIAGKKLIATDQFQAFLDDLAKLLNTASSEETQELFTLSVEMGASRANIRVNSKQIAELFSLSASLSDAFDDLEQVVYAL